MCVPFKGGNGGAGYLAGHAARTYKSGLRTCGVTLPEGLRENDQLPQPIITPTTKASEGHDEDISKEEIIKQGDSKQGALRTTRTIHAGSLCARAGNGQ